MGLPLSTPQKRAPSYSAMVTNATGERLAVGLCLHCRYMRRMNSDRGSAFYLCERSASDSAFPKYPRLPVWQCRGYEPITDPSEPARKPGS